MKSGIVKGAKELVAVDVHGTTHTISLEGCYVVRDDRLWVVRRDASDQAVYKCAVGRQGIADVRIVFPEVVKVATMRHTAMLEALCELYKAEAVAGKGLADGLADETGELEALLITYFEEIMKAQKGFIEKNAAVESARYADEK